MDFPGVNCSYNYGNRQTHFYPPGDGLSSSRGMEFSTFDNDNDDWSIVNCAARRGGANWWENCGWNNINGKYGRNGDIGWEFMFWWHFDHNEMALKSMTLMFREAN